MLKKRYTELLMACLLILCFYVLSQKAADAFRTAQTAGEKTRTQESHNTELGQQTQTGQPAKEETPAGQERQPASGQRIIVIDAGHGGSDPGMIGVNQLEEKGINLAIALKLKAILEKRDYVIYMTRENDQGLYDENSRNKKAQDMEGRIRIIRESSPKLAVSIHQNSFSDPKVCGPQVFYYEGSGEGEDLAKCIQNRLNKNLEIARPRAEKGNRSYYLLKKSPAVLTIVECGFLTNPGEADLLQSEDYQARVAEAIADGIQDYLENNEIPREVKN